MQFLYLDWLIIPEFYLPLHQQKGSQNDKRYPICCSWRCCRQCLKICRIILVSFLKQFPMGNFVCQSYRFFCYRTYLRLYLKTPKYLTKLQPVSHSRSMWWFYHILCIFKRKSATTSDRKLLESYLICRSKHYFGNPTCSFRLSLYKIRFF